MGTVWIVIADVLLATGFSGAGWAIPLGIAAIVYAIFLFKGGRMGFWFF